MTLILALALGTLVNAAAPHPVPEAVVRGDWCAASEYAFHEEFSLTVEDGVHVFYSWLHQKPALTGTWSLSGRSLIIHGENGDVMRYNIMSASRKRLIIKQVNEKHSETYRRPGNCPKPYDPYTDPKFHDATPPN